MAGGSLSPRPPGRDLSNFGQASASPALILTRSLEGLPRSAATRRWLWRLCRGVPPCGSGKVWSAHLEGFAQSSPVLPLRPRQGPVPGLAEPAAVRRAVMPPRAAHGSAGETRCAWEDAELPKTPGGRGSPRLGSRAPAVGMRRDGSAPSSPGRTEGSRGL